MERGGFSFNYQLPPLLPPSHLPLLSPSLYRSPPVVAPPHQPPPPPTPPSVVFYAIFSLYHPTPPFGRAARPLPLSGNDTASLSPYVAA